jgi:hypothetical protein
LAAATAPVWVPPVWVSDAFVPQSEAAGLALAGARALDGAALDDAAPDCGAVDVAGDPVGAGPVGIGASVDEAAAGDGVAAVVNGLGVAAVDGSVPALAAEVTAVPALAGAHAAAGACAVVVVVSHPGEIAAGSSAGDGTGLGVLVVAAGFDAGDVAAEAFAVGALELEGAELVGGVGVACGEAVLVVPAGIDAEALGLAVLALVGPALGGASGATGSDAEVAAPVALAVADGSVEGPGVGALAAEAESLGVGALALDGTALVGAVGKACGDAEVAALAVVAEADGEAVAAGIAVGSAEIAVVDDVGCGDWLDAAGVAGSLEELGAEPAASDDVQAAWVAVSSPFPKMLACTAAATLDAERTIARVMAAARDRLPCLASSTAAAIWRSIRLRLATSSFSCSSNVSPEADPRGPASGFRPAATFSSPVNTRALLRGVGERLRVWAAGSRLTEFLYLPLPLVEIETGVVRRILVVDHRDPRFGRAAVGDVAARRGHVHPAGEVDDVEVRGVAALVTDNLQLDVVFDVAAARVLIAVHAGVAASVVFAGVRLIAAAAGGSDGVAFVPGLVLVLRDADVAAVRAAIGEDAPASATACRTTGGVSTPIGVRARVRV